MRKSDLGRLSERVAISALTLAELTKGRHSGVSDFEKERRRRRLQRIEATIESLSFDAACARAFDHVAIAVKNIGRSTRGSRSVDLMIAATALAHDLPLATLNSKDFRGLENLIEVFDLGIRKGSDP